MEMANSGANLVSDRKVGFSRHLECALADFYGHFLSRSLHMHGMMGMHSPLVAAIAVLCRHVTEARMHMWHGVLTSQADMK